MDGKEHNFNSYNSFTEGGHIVNSVNDKLYYCDASPSAHGKSISDLIGNINSVSGGVAEYIGVESVQWSNEDYHNLHVTFTNG